MVITPIHPCLNTHEIHNSKKESNLKRKVEGYQTHSDNLKSKQMLAHALKVLSKDYFMCMRKLNKSRIMNSQNFFFFLLKISQNLAFSV